MHIESKHHFSGNSNQFVKNRIKKTKKKKTSIKCKCRILPLKNSANPAQAGGSCTCLAVWLGTCVSWLVHWRLPNTKCCQVNQGTEELCRWNFQNIVTIALTVKKPWVRTFNSFLKLYSDKMAYFIKQLENHFAFERKKSCF